MYDLDQLQTDDLMEFLASQYEILKQHRDILGDSWDQWEDEE